MTTHYKRIIGDRVQAALPGLVGDWQQESPARLLPTPWVTVRAAVELDVSGSVVRKYLTDAVADEELIEILVRRDWLVMLPHRYGLLYAEPEGNRYRLTRHRPTSRGSNGISFLTTPEGHTRLLGEAVKAFLTGR